MCSWLTMGPGEDASEALEKEVWECQGQLLHLLCHEKLTPAKYPHRNICSGWQRQCQAG